MGGMAIFPRIECSSCQFYILPLGLSKKVTFQCPKSRVNEEVETRIEVKMRKIKLGNQWLLVALFFSFQPFHDKKIKLQLAHTSSTLI